MRGLPHSDDPEKTIKGELWVGVTPSGWSPMRRAPEGCEAKGRGLMSFDIKPYEIRTPA
jgi:hypothetical protein